MVLDKVSEIMKNSMKSGRMMKQTEHFASKRFIKRPVNIYKPLTKDSDVEICCISFCIDILNLIVRDINLSPCIRARRKRWRTRETEMMK